MTDFDNIIKEKIKQFSVPYNDEHWKEIEIKLDNNQRFMRLKQGLVFAVGIIVALSVFVYLYTQQQPIEEKRNTSEVLIKKKVIVDSELQSEEEITKYEWYFSC